LRRKIALLLAFVMVFSLLPMSVAANVPATILPPGSNTGVRVEPTAGPTVRHMANGTLVARPGTIAAFRASLLGTSVESFVLNNPGIIDTFGLSSSQLAAAMTINDQAGLGNAYTAQADYVDAPIGNLRHMLVSSTIFNHRTVPLTEPDHVRATLTMSNAHWLAHYINFPLLGNSTPGSLLPQQTNATSAALVADQLGTAWSQGRIAAFQLVQGSPAMLIAIETNAPGTTGRTVAHLHAFRLITDVAWTQAHLVTTPLQGMLPIEYVTRGGANDNPVSIAINPWTGVANVHPSLVLTEVLERRLNITRPGDIRHFHGYSSALVSDGIRVGEAAHGAFAAPGVAAGGRHNIMVRSEIVTPGFYWAGNNDDITVSFQAGTNLDATLPTGQNRIWREPSNRAREGNNIIYTVVNVNNDQRAQTAWFQLNGLEVQASSRARAEEVRVDVRVYHAFLGGQGGQGGSWNWDVLRYSQAAAGAANRVSPVQTRNALFGAFPQLQRELPPVPTNAHLAQEHVFTTAGSWVQQDGTPVAADTVAPAEGLWRLVWHWVPGWTGQGWVGDPFIDDNEITVANFGDLGLVFERHADDDLADFPLRSGMREWEPANWDTGSFFNAAGVMPASVVLPEEEYHMTARMVLREIAPGAMLSNVPIHFIFPEGVQVLGAELWANDSHFTGGFNDDDGFVWFDGRTTGIGNFLNARIIQNTLTVRPEFTSPRYTPASITAQFYISIKPGFEAYFGTDVIEVRVETGSSFAPFEAEDDAALVWDPISVDTTSVVIDDSDIAAFNHIRGVSLEDITVTLTDDTSLSAGDIIWLGVEGGISRSWGAADHVSIDAGRVDVIGAPNLELSAPRRDSHGVAVQVIRGFAYADTQLIFRDVSISGQVIPGQAYNIIVAGDAVANNWSRFNWIQGLGLFGILGHGVPHGWFDVDPYAQPAFSFDGTDVAHLGAPGEAPAPPVAVTIGPREVRQNTPFNTSLAHEQPIFPTIEMVPTADPDFATAFMPMAIVRDILGWPNATFDSTARTGTFVTTDGRTIVFTEGSPTVMVNGQPMQMLDAINNPVNARINANNGRFMVPIRFFQELGVATVQFNPAGGPGNFTVMVIPQ